MARWLGCCPGEDHKCNSKSPRLPDRGRARPAAGSRRGCIEFAAGILHETCRGIPQAPRSPNARADCGRLQMLPPTRRLLRDDRHLRLRFRQRRFLRQTPRQRYRRSLRPGIEFLSRPARRRKASPLRLLQKDRNPRRRRTKAGQTPVVTNKNRPTKGDSKKTVPKKQFKKGSLKKAS